MRVASLSAAYTLSRPQLQRLAVLFAILISLMTPLALNPIQVQVYADPTTSEAPAETVGSLDEVITEQATQADQPSQDTQTSQDTNYTNTTGTTNTPDTLYNKYNNKSFIQGLNKAADLSPEVDGTQKIIAPLRYGVAFVVQVLSFIIITGMALSVVLDLTYLAVTPLRSVLSNGHSGSALPAGQQASAQPGGFQPGGFPSLYNFKQGPTSGFGPPQTQAGLPGAMNPGQPGQPNNGPGGRIQLVSKAALDAAANEGTIDPNTSKTRGLISLYMKGMGLKLILIPVLLILVVTGSLTNLGFVVADVLVAVIRLLGEMLGGITL